jgi:hypothetical protein
VLCSNTSCTFHSTCCTMLKFNTPPPRTSTLRKPLIKLSRNNIYLHCAHTNKIPLCSVNTAQTMQAIIMRVHTTHASITHALLNLHCAMLNLSVQTCAPIFSVHYHFAQCSAKFKCAVWHTNIFRALPLYIAQPQN